MSEQAKTDESLPNQAFHEVFEVSAALATCATSLDYLNYRDPNEKTRPVDSQTVTMGIQAILISCVKRLEALLAE